MTTRNNDPDIVDAHLGLFRSPSAEQISESEDRTLHRLRAEATRVPPTEPARGLSLTWRFAIAGAAAAVLAAIVIALPWRSAPFATLVADGVYELADGSRVEMRPRTELSFERADDGVRIRLSRGGIIVTAAKQRDGHLYVQTKDVIVSVVGTVFLVNAEEEGSRVAVIEGEVRVQQGATEENLLAGQQVVTSPLMLAPGLSEQLAWSRNAPAHLALLEQQSAPAQTLPAASTSEPRETFETATVRLAPPLPIGARVGGPAAAASAPPGLETGVTCFGLDSQLDPRRFYVSSISVHGLITMAYGRSCQTREQITGGPDWARFDGYNVEALIPVGTPAYTVRQLRNNAAPKIQAMLQNLLVDRFKLMLRREMREMAAYNLVVVTEGKLKPSVDTPPERLILPFPANGRPVPALRMYGTTMSRFADSLQGYTGRPVIDKTGVTGLFDLVLEFTDLAGAGAGGADLRPSQAERLPGLLQEQLGLRLEAVRAPVEFLVIDRVDRPTEN